MNRIGRTVATSSAMRRAALQLKLMGSLSLAITACKFSELPPLDPDATPAIDSASVDSASVDSVSADAASVDAMMIDAITPIDAATRYTLTLTIDGASSGTGSISVQPGGFTCSAAMCTRMYNEGDELTITVAGASSLDGVTSISGDCNTSPCVLTMDANRTVTSRFVRYACVPNSASCTANAFTQCDGTGNYVTHVIPNGAANGSATTITMNNYACPMGCHATGSRCADITLGNGVEAAMDTVQVSPTGRDIVLPGPGAPNGTISIVTNNFDAAQGLIRVTDTDGSPVDIPAQVVDQGNGAGTILVLKTRTFHMRAGSSLRAIGTHKLGIAAHFDIFLGGKLDLRGDYDGEGYSPGAGAGGPSTCFGTASTTTNGATGGGASACGGGASSTGLAGGVPSSIQPPFVVGGCGGGRTASLFSFPTPSGGGLLLASRTKIVLASGSAIDLTGSGGGGSANFASGAAAGGNAALFAPSVRVDSGAVVSARGGSGGAASSSGGVSGNRGPLMGTERAAGVSCAGCGTSGAGGYEGSGSCGGLNATGTGTAIAGGGGGEGRCYLFARSGGGTVAAGTMKCAYNLGSLSPR